MDFDFSGKSEKKDEKAEVNVVLVLITWVVALGSVVPLYMAQNLRSDAFYLFTAYVIREMRLFDYIGVFTLGCFLAALALFLSAFLTTVSALLSSRTGTKVGLGMMILSSTGCVIGGVYSTRRISGFDNDVNGVGVSDVSTGQVQDFASAMYGECCIKPGFVQDTTTSANLWPILEPTDMENYLFSLQTCDDFYSDNRDFTSLKNQLVHCIRNRDNVEYFRLATTPWMCDTLDTSINIEGKELNGFRLSTFTNDQTVISIIGEASKEGNYGCGGGKVKAFMFAVYLWFESSCAPLAFVLTIVGGISLLLSFFGVASSCLSESSSDYQMDMEMVRAYMAGDLEVESNRTSRTSEPQLSRVPEEASQCSSVASNRRSEAYSDVPVAVRVTPNDSVL